MEVPTVEGRITVAEHNEETINVTADRSSENRIQADSHSIGESSGDWLRRKNKDPKDIKN